MASKALQFMTATEAAAFLGVDKYTFHRWIRTKDAPPRRLIGKRYYYQREFLLDWLQAPLPAPKPGSARVMYVKNAAA
jgi:excisionase family DNA binding protein